MRKALRPQLGRDAKGLPVVELAGRAAAGGDQLHMSPERDEGTQCRRRPFTVQGHHLVGRRDGGAGGEIEGGSLLAPDSRHLFPALVPPCRPNGALGGRQVPVSYTHLRAHETVLDLVCRLLLEKKK